ncbi:MAG: hypothetical protein SFV55_13385 [Haliscomenobacter sp.]|uniref:hypothetical protein n=1 Tax=Haliscomenobacter sp. TaxID=2717303 RepID=UPI0029BEDF6D|nr:hypothetical protein [Haliscomenobacter sp.]MDX2069413.1 hypothetical protein [Haliscomenobacter sp.]
MHKRPHYLFVWVILIYVNVPGIAQIDPLKAAKDLGKSVPVKRDPAPNNPNSSRPTSSNNNPAPPSTGTNSPTPLDASAESSPAKSFIASFWKAIDKLKAASAAQQYHLYYSNISSAETNLRNIKMRDPNYDTKALEAELDKYKAEQQGASAQKETTRDIAANTIGFLSDLFGSDQTSYSTNLTYEQGVSAHQEKLQAFTSKVNQFLASNPDQSVIKSKEAIATQKANYVAGKVAEYEKSINENTSKAGLTTHRELIGMDVYWSAVVKIFPNLPAPAFASQAVKAALARLGTEAEMLAKFNKNEVEKMKNTKMPAAVTVNPALEAEFKKVIAEMGWKESVVKINLLTRDWTTLYHSVTGNIIARTQQAAVVAKKNDGNCILYSITIVQEHTGAGKYGSSKHYSDGVLADKFLCENAK